MCGEVENFTTGQLLWSLTNSLLKLLKWLNWVVVIVRQSWRVFLNHSVLFRKLISTQNMQRLPQSAVSDPNAPKCRFEIKTYFLGTRRKESRLWKGIKPTPNISPPRYHGASILVPSALDFQGEVQFPMAGGGLYATARRRMMQNNSTVLATHQKCCWWVEMLTRCAERMLHFLLSDNANNAVPDSVFLDCSAAQWPSRL